MQYDIFGISQVNYFTFLIDIIDIILRGHEMPKDVTFNMGSDCLFLLTITWEIQY